MNDAWARLLSNVAWILLIAVLVGWRFYNPVKKLIEAFEKLIPRIQKIGPTGADIGPLQDSAPPKLTELSINAAADPVIGEKQVAIAKDLEKFRREEREEVLIAALARTQINLGHERVYGNIFGSQLAALQILANEGPKTREEGIGYFEEVQKLNPIIHEKRTFDERLIPLPQVNQLLVPDAA